MLSTAKRRRPTRRTPERDSGPSRLKVAVLMGGVGYEREVSLVSGSQVARALREEGHDVLSCVLDGADENTLDAIPKDVDVVFIALHGEFGEDGQVQRALAARGLCYTGSGPEASARAYDKLRAKRQLRRARLPVACQRVLEVPFGERDLRHALRMTPPGRVVVKPPRMGSSVGVVVCDTPFQLRRALEEGTRFCQPLMIEEFIPGHELTCAVLDGQALPVVEVLAERGFYDYKAKYEQGSGTRYVIEPDGIPEVVRDSVRRLALRSHEALGCEEMSRVDFRYDPATGRIVILELNTIPGLTPTSLLPKSAGAVGIAFGKLCELICRLAVRSAAR